MARSRGAHLVNADGERYINELETRDVVASANIKQVVREKKGIETKIQHPILMPDQEAYQHLKKFRIPNAKSLRELILCIPANEKITREESQYVIDSIKTFYGT